MFTICRTLAVAWLIIGVADAALAEDTTQGAPKAPPSQSSYTPKDKTGANSPAKPAPEAKDKNGAPASQSGK